MLTTLSPLMSGVVLANGAGANGAIWPKYPAMSDRSSTLMVPDMLASPPTRVTVPAAFDPAFVKAAGGVGPAAAEVLNTTRWPRLPDLADAPWKGTPALTRNPRAVAGRRTFAVGDAAGYVEPFTGEGMAWAVAGAAALGPIAHAAAAGWTEAHAEQWRRAHARVVAGRQGVCRAAARALRSPAFTRLAVRVLSVIPALARPVTFALNRPARPAHGPAA